MALLSKRFGLPNRDLTTPSPAIISLLCIFISPIEFCYLSHLYMALLRLQRPGLPNQEIIAMVVHVKEGMSSNGGPNVTGIITDAEGSEMRFRAFGNDATEVARNLQQNRSYRFKHYHLIPNDPKYRLGNIVWQLNIIKSTTIENVDDIEMAEPVLRRIGTLKTLPVNTFTSVYGILTETLEINDVSFNI